MPELNSDMLQTVRQLAEDMMHDDTLPKGLRSKLGSLTMACTNVQVELMRREIRSRVDRLASREARDKDQAEMFTDDTNPTMEEAYSNE